MVSDWIVPETKKSLPTRGINSSVVIWMQEKAARDGQLWGNGLNLWVIQNKVYDLTAYIGSHPGGQGWIANTRGQDITELFITHHLNEAKARKVLAKFYVRESQVKLESRFSFQEDGLFRTVKKRLLSTFPIEQLQNTTKSMVNGMQILLLWLIFFLLSGLWQSYLTSMIAGMLLLGIVGIGHNFVHMRSHPFKYFYLLTGFTHQQWEIMHCLSHHSYTNTLLDYQIQGLEPIVYYLKVLPQNRFIYGILKEAIFIFFVPSNIFLKLIVVPITQRKSPEWLYLVPLIQIPLLCLITHDLGISLKIFLAIHATFGFIFMKFALIGHRTGREWTEGNTQIRDFAEHQIYSSTDVKTNFTSGFFSYLFYAGFNNHAIHHLFPTIDNHYLPMAKAILDEQAKKIGVRINEVKGIFEGLLCVQQNFYNRKEWKKGGQ